MGISLVDPSQAVSRDVLGEFSGGRRGWMAVRAFRRDGGRVLLLIRKVATGGFAPGSETFRAGLLSKRCLWVLELHVNAARLAATPFYDGLRT